MHTNDTADSILAAIEESEMVWPHNDLLSNDHAVDMAVQVALSKPTADLPADYPASVLRQAGKRPGVVRRLFDVVFGKAASSWTDYDLFKAPCDRCLADIQPEHVLWVPSGRSVVELHVCHDCRTTLDADFPGIAWE